MKMSRARQMWPAETVARPAQRLGLGTRGLLRPVGERCDSGRCVGAGRTLRGGFAENRRSERKGPRAVSCPCDVVKSALRQVRLGKVSAAWSSRLGGPARRCVWCAGGPALASHEPSEGSNGTTCRPCVRSLRVGVKGSLLVWSSALGPDGAQTAGMGLPGVAGSVRVKG